MHPHNGLGEDHSMTLRSGLADSRILKENSCSTDILVIITSVLFIIDGRLSHIMWTRE
jgi:hypothetical protein